MFLFLLFLFVGEPSYSPSQYIFFQRNFSVTTHDKLCGKMSCDRALSAFCKTEFGCISFASKPGSWFPNSDTVACSCTVALRAAAFVYAHLLRLRARVNRARQDTVRPDNLMKSEKGEPPNLFPNLLARKKKLFEPRFASSVCCASLSHLLSVFNGKGHFEQ